MNAKFAALVASTAAACGTTPSDAPVVTVPYVSAAKRAAAATGTRPARRASNYRCPNPRDCGDPTCDGSCGY